ncbi:hypothetical protein FPV67DRAFT_421735 [Lyophyllum atratum]|nr:hypothetical protein FPV67DRAFT_421735 [Lyophyllum atratum]
MNTTSWGYPQNNTDVDSRRHMYRASTSPAAGYPTHPIALMPGQVPQAIDRPNLYFTNATRMPIANDVRNMYNATPPPAVPLYPAHITSHFQPPSSVPASLLPPPRPPLPPSFSDNHSSTLLHRSFTSPPPVPPKPFSAPPIPPQRDNGPSHLAISLPGATLPVPSLDSPTDEGDIAMALAISESVAKEEQKAQQYLASQEEEDLARALEASMLESRRPSLPRIPVSNAAASSSSSIPPLASSQSPPNDDTLVNDACDDEAFARFMAAEHAEQNMTPGMSKITDANQFPSPSRDAGPPRYPTTGGAIPTHVTLSGHTNDMHLRHDHPVASPSKDLLSADLPGFELKRSPSGSSKASTSSDIRHDEVSARLLAEEQEGRSTTTQSMKTEDHHVKRSAPQINDTDLPQYAASGSQRPSEIDNCDDDEAFARWLATGEVKHNQKVPDVQAARHFPPLRANILPHYSARDEFLDDNAPTPVASTSHETMIEDEAYSRSLDKTYEQISPASTSLSKDNDAYIGGGFHSAPQKASEPPCYSPQSVGEDDWSSSSVGPSTKRNESYTSLAPSGRLSKAMSSSSDHGRDLIASPVANMPSNGVAYPNLAPSFYADGISSTASESSHTSTSHSERPSVVVWNAPQHAPESTSSSYPPPLPSSSVSSSSDHSLTAPNLRLETGLLTPTGSLSRISSMTSLSERYAEDYVESDELRPSPSAVNLNAFVEKELFNGVCE